MVRIGVIGLGTFGINHLRAFAQTAREGVAQLVTTAANDHQVPLTAAGGQRAESRERSGGPAASVI